MVTDLWYTHILNFGSLSSLWRCKEHPCPSGHDLGLWWGLEVPGWSLYSLLIMIGIWSLVFDTAMIQIWFSILILKVQRTFISFESSFWVLEDAGCSWLGFGILILIWICSLVFYWPIIITFEDAGVSSLGFGILIFILICSLVFDTPRIQILALYLDLEAAKNIHVL